MAAQAQIEGRFLGGRPPYGYLLVDAGPHPNPAKAADGKRLHALDLDPETAPVVRADLRRVPRRAGPLRHRRGPDRATASPARPPTTPRATRTAAASPGHGVAVRAILANPRYTGHQVWNKQRKDEVLIDVDDVALGHATKQRWNEPGKWIWSEQPVHEPLIDDRDLRAGPGAAARQGFDRRAVAAPHAPPVRPARHPALRPLRPQDARQLEQRQAPLPLHVPQRVRGEEQGQPPASGLPARGAAASATRRMAVRACSTRSRSRTTVRELQAAQPDEPRAGRGAHSRRSPTATPSYASTAPRSKREPIRCSSPAGSKRPRPGALLAEARLKKPTGRRRMTTEEITSLVTALGDLMQVLEDADPADKAEIYSQPRPDAHLPPGGKRVEAESDRIRRVRKRVSEGGLEPPRPLRALAPQASASAYSATRTGDASRRLAQVSKLRPTMRSGSPSAELASQAGRPAPPGEPAQAAAVRQAGAVRGWERDRELRRPGLRMRSSTSAET